MVFTIPIDRNITPIHIKKSNFSDSLNAIHVSSDQSIHFTGIFPDTLYPLVYTGKSKGTRLWQGHILGPNTIETIEKTNEVDALDFKSTDVRMILIPKNFIEQCLRDAFVDDNVQKYYPFSTYEINDEDLKVFLDIHFDILHNKHIAKEEIRAFLVTMLQNPGKEEKPLEKGYLLVKKAIALMKEHFKEPLKIRELADKLDISMRSLEMAFCKHIGVSPKVYYKRLLLLYVEMELRNSRNSTVSNVVEDFQIYNLSQFGASFKEYFNTTPSQVLQLQKDGNPFGWNEKVFQNIAQVIVEEKLEES